MPVDELMKTSINVKVFVIKHKLLEKFISCSSQLLQTFWSSNSVQSTGNSPAGDDQPHALRIQWFGMMFFACCIVFNQGPIERFSVQSSGQKLTVHVLALRYPQAKIQYFDWNTVSFLKNIVNHTICFSRKLKLCKYLFEAWKTSTGNLFEKIAKWKKETPLFGFLSCAVLTHLRLSSPALQKLPWQLQVRSG